MLSGPRLIIEHAWRHRDAVTSPFSSSQYTDKVYVDVNWLNRAAAGGMMSLCVGDCIFNGLMSMQRRYHEMKGRVFLGYTAPSYHTLAAYRR